MSDDLDHEAIRERLDAATLGPWRVKRASWERGFTSQDWEHPEVWGVVAGESTVHQNVGNFHPDNAEYTLDEIAVVQISYDRDYGSAEAAISREADAEFIAHAPSDIAALLAENDALRKRIDAARGAWIRIDRLGNRVEDRLDLVRALNFVPTEERKK